MQSSLVGVVWGDNCLGAIVLGENCLEAIIQVVIVWEQLYKEELS